MGTMPSWVPWTSLAVLCWFALGCGPTEMLLPVSGTVLLDEKPLTTGYGELTLYPDAGQGNQSARLPIADIRSDGTYTVTTIGKTGAPPGAYKVVVLASRDPLPSRTAWNPDGTLKGVRLLHPKKYLKPQTTDLRIEVTEKTAPGSYDLHLSR